MASTGNHNETIRKESKALLTRPMSSGVDPGEGFRYGPGPSKSLDTSRFYQRPHQKATDRQWAMSPAVTVKDADLVESIQPATLDETTQVTPTVEVRDTADLIVSKDVPVLSSEARSDLHSLLENEHGDIISIFPEPNSTSAVTTNDARLVNPDRRSEPKVSDRSDARSSNGFEPTSKSLSPKPVGQTGPMSTDCTTHQSVSSVTNRTGDRDAALLATTAHQDNGYHRMQSNPVSQPSAIPQDGSNRARSLLDLTTQHRAENDTLARSIRSPVLPAMHAATVSNTHQKNGRVPENGAARQPTGPTVATGLQFAWYTMQLEMEQISKKEQAKQEALQDHISHLLEKNKHFKQSLCQTLAERDEFQKFSEDLESSNRLLSQKFLTLQQAMDDLGKKLEEGRMQGLARAKEMSELQSDYRRQTADYANIHQIVQDFEARNATLKNALRTLQNEVGTNLEDFGRQHDDLKEELQKRDRRLAEEQALTSATLERMESDMLKSSHFGDQLGAMSMTFLAKLQSIQESLQHAIDNSSVRTQVESCISLLQELSTAKPVVAETFSDFQERVQTLRISLSDKLDELTSQSRKAAERDKHSNSAVLATLEHLQAQVASHQAAVADVISLKAAHAALEQAGKDKDRQITEAHGMISDLEVFKREQESQSQLRAQEMLNLLSRLKDSEVYQSDVQAAETQILQLQKRLADLETGFALAKEESRDQLAQKNIDIDTLKDELQEARTSMKDLAVRLEDESSERLSSLRSKLQRDFDKLHHDHSAQFENRIHHSEQQRDKVEKALSSTREKFNAAQDICRNLKEQLLKKTEELQTIADAESQLTTDLQLQTGLKSELATVTSANDVLQNNIEQITEQLKRKENEILELTAENIAAKAKMSKLHSTVDNYRRRCKEHQVSIRRKRDIDNRTEKPTFGNGMNYTIPSDLVERLRIYIADEILWMQDYDKENLLDGMLSSCLNKIDDVLHGDFYVDWYPDSEDHELVPDDQLIDPIPKSRATLHDCSVVFSNPSMHGSVIRAQVDIASAEQLTALPNSQNGPALVTKPDDSGLLSINDRSARFGSETKMFGVAPDEARGSLRSSPPNLTLSDPVQSQNSVTRSAYFSCDRKTSPVVQADDASRVPSKKKTSLPLGAEPRPSSLNRVLPNTASRIVHSVPKIAGQQVDGRNSSPVTGGMSPTVPGSMSAFVNQRLDVLKRQREVVPVEGNSVAAVTEEERPAKAQATSSDRSTTTKAPSSSLSLPQSLTEVGNSRHANTKNSDRSRMRSSNQIKQTKTSSAKRKTGKKSDRYDLRFAQELRE